MQLALCAALAFFATVGSPSPIPASAVPLPIVDAGFDNGFAGWNLDGVGDVAPSITDGIVSSGSGSARFALIGSQSRSELTLDDGSGTIEFREGVSRIYAFSFLVHSMQWGRPGAHNLITQFKSDGEGSPNFGLQLWDYGGRRGLWSTGKAMGGDRFLARISRRGWNDVVIRFKASRTRGGRYEVYLNGKLVDSRDHASLIRRDRTFFYIKAGLYRNGDVLTGPSEIWLDNVRLGTRLKQVRP